MNQEMNQQAKEQDLNTIVANRIVGTLGDMIAEAERRFAGRDYLPRVKPTEARDWKTQIAVCREIAEQLEMTAAVEAEVRWLIESLGPDPVDLEAEAEQAPQTFKVQIEAKERSINARGRGYNCYALIGYRADLKDGKPGRLQWATELPHVVLSDSFPRSSGIRAAERRGSMVIETELQPGDVVVYVWKYTDGTVKRGADIIDHEGDKVAIDVKNAKRASGWISILADGSEWQ